MNHKRRAQYYNLNRKYLYPSIAATPAAATIIVVVIIYFKMDPIPLYFQYDGMIFNTSPTLQSKIAHLFIFGFRVVYTSLLALECARLSIEILLLIIFLFQMYEFSLAFLARLRTPFVYFNFAMKLQLCHAAMQKMVNSFYVIYLTWGQAAVVVFLMLTLKAMNHAPFLFYICCPCFSMTIGAMTFLMIDFLGATVFMRSSSLVRYWAQPGHGQVAEKLFSLKALTRRGQAQFPMSFSCGPFFVIRRETALLYLNAVLINLANIVLLVDF